MSSLRVRCWSRLLPLLGFCLLLHVCAGCVAQVSSPADKPAPERVVRVLDELGRPLAGAEVAFLPASEGLGLADVTRDCELSFAAAPRVRSGDDGCVVLPTEAASVAAVARCGNRFGAGLLHFADRTLVRPELVLAPDRHVHVQVRDAAGRPRAFVPVEARIPASQWEQFRSWNIAPIGTTDAVGRLTLWHAQRLCSWEPRQPRFALRAVVVGAEVEFAPVDLTEPSTDAVQLVCPPHGWLVVQRWLAPGIPDGSEGYLCGWRIQDDYDGARPPQAFGEFLPASIGTWRSRPLALGQRWRVQWPNVSRDVVGQVQDGDCVRFDHALQASKPYAAQWIGVVAALQRPDGTPCAHAAVQLSGVLLAQTSDSDRVRTDAEGKLRFVTQHGAVDFTVVGENLCAEVAIPRRPPDHVVDLGIVRLVPARTLASGRCVDAQTGLPILAELRGDGATWSWRTGSDGMFHLVDDPRSRWTSASVVQARIFPALGRQGLCFGYHERRHAIRVDRTDNELALPRARLLRSRLRLDATLGGSSIALRVRLPDGSLAFDGPTHEVAGLRQQAFVLPDDLRDPSAARLEVHSDDDESPLAVVDGTSFRPTPDGFDVELDLRGALEEYDVFTDGIEDMPFQGHWFVRSRGEQRWRRMTLQRHVSLVVRRGAEIEAVFAPSFQPWQRRTLTTTYTRWRPEPVSQLDLTWDAPELPGVEVGVLVLLRQLADRELAGVVDPRVDADDDPHLEREHAWPLAPDALTALHANPGWGKEVRSTAAQQMRVWQLGQYVVVPYAKTAKGLHWFVEQAVPFELVRAGSKVEVAVRVPAAAMQAAIEAK